MQASSVDRGDTKCLAAAADNSRLTWTSDVDRVTVDDVTTSTNHATETPACVVDPARRAGPVLDGDGVEKATPAPVEANVVLVPRPGDLPPSTTYDASTVVVQPAGETIGNTGASNRRRTIGDDARNADSISGQSATRGVRRPRKRSSLCNNVDVDDDALADVEPSDALTTGGRKTSVPHPRHAASDTADREHRPKRKGTTHTAHTMHVARVHSRRRSCEVRNV